jgi:prepilin signal peptidase PulO-like enzyme (type II secretory pathway)
MLLGYRIDAGEAEELYVWPMAEKKKKGAPPDTGADAAPAPENGDGKIWVTPKIPFILPITAAVIITAVIGNVIFLI